MIKACLLLLVKKFYSKFVVLGLLPNFSKIPCKLLNSQFTIHARMVLLLIRRRDDLFIDDEFVFVTLLCRVVAIKIILSVFICKIIMNIRIVLMIRALYEE